MTKPYQTEEEKTQLFMRVLDEFISSGETGSLSVRDASDVLKMNISAMSLDVLSPRGEKFVDELNTYSSMECFQDCFNATICGTGSWDFEGDEDLNPVPCIKIPEIKIHQEAHKKDLYITEDMEGFEEVLNRLRTYCEAIVL